MQRRTDRIAEGLAVVRTEQVVIPKAWMEDHGWPVCSSMKAYESYSHESPTHTVTHRWLEVGWVRESGSLKHDNLVLRYDPVAALGTLASFEKLPVQG